MLLHCEPKKTPQRLLSYFPQNMADSDKIWCVLSQVNLPYNNVNLFHLTWIMSLHYHVKLKICFCENSNAGTTTQQILLTIIVARFTEIDVSCHKLGRHYFSMPAERNKYTFQCSASSPSGLNWSTASSTSRLSISGAQGWGRAFATMASRINFYSYIAISLIRIGDIANSN